MDLNSYQIIARSTADYADKFKIIYPGFGLCGEAGEVAEKIKKVLRDNNGDFTDALKSKIALELGDSLWYIAILSEDLGFTLQDIADLNINKLADRKKRNKIHGSGDFR